MTLKSKKPKKKYLNQNISYLLKQFDIDIKSLSAETGIPVATISRIKQDDSNPTISSLEPLADFFRINVHEMIYEDMSSKYYQTKNEMGTIAHIPIITLQDVINWPCESKIIKFVVSAGITNKNIFGVRIENDVMAPAFKNGAIAIIDPYLHPREGDYTLCLLDEEELPVFRQVFIDGKHYFFRPLNPAYGTLKEYNKFKILGIVIKSMEDFR